MNWFYWKIMELSDKYPAFLVWLWDRANKKFDKEIARRKKLGIKED